MSLRLGLRFCWLVLLPLWWTGCSPAEPESPEPPVRDAGFDLSNALIPRADIRDGGPGKDGIPAIDRPKFAPAGEVRFLRPDDQVVSVTVSNVTRAYPLRVLVWHEIVNDTVAGLPLAVTYCPLCGTAMVFDRQFGGTNHTFGVSGLLYQSDVLMYDRQTQSLWSQLAMKAVAGPAAGQPLMLRESQQLTWGAWRLLHPQGEVLTPDTGFARDYVNLPYGGYEQREETVFPVPRHRTELRNKEWVLGVVVQGRAAAFPLAALGAASPLEHSVGELKLRVEYDPATQAARVTEAATGRGLPHIRSYWFAWQAFYPDTLLWQPR